MLRKTLLAACVLAMVATMPACKRGQGSNDTLADGRTDSPSGNSGSVDVGPSSPPVDAADPAVANSPSQPAVAPPGGATGPTLMLVSQGPHAPFVGSGAGNALYYVDGDRDGSKCVGDCVQTWPPVTVTEAQPSAGAGLQGAMVATVTRPDGGRQVTFSGHPLYRYAADGGAASANGDGVKDKFGSWHLATPGMAGAPNGQGAQSSGNATTAAPKPTQ